MKRLFKLGFVAMAITLSAAACSSGNKGSESTDSVANAIDSTADVTSDSLEAQADTVDSAADAHVDSLKH
jgi:hypothetical protein